MFKYFSIAFLGLLLFLAVFRDFLANGRPLSCKVQGESFYPGLKVMVSGAEYLRTHPVLGKFERETPYEHWKDPKNFDEPPIYALIPFTPGEYSTRHLSGLLAPGSVQPGLDSRFRHWLGTDSVGRDVAASLISGARVALLTGSVAMCMALLIGMFLGTIAGYYGDERLSVSKARLWLTLAGVPFAVFLAFIQHQHALENAQSALIWWKNAGLFLGILAFFNGLGWALSRIPFLASRVSLPADLVIMRAAEIFNALPKLVVIIALSVILQRQNDSIWLLIILIGAMSWTGVARFVRAELLRVREMEYVQAARGLGLKEWQILLRHALPNAMRPVWVAMAFGVAGAVTLEATLSFLGFGGESLKGKSWGSLLSLDSGQSNPVGSWWVMLPAGLMVCFTVLSFNSIGEKMQETS